MMNYLIVEGYRDAAAHFLEESGTQPKVDLRTIEDRVAIRKVGVCRLGCRGGRNPESTYVKCWTSAIYPSIITAVITPMIFGCAVFSCPSPYLKQPKHLLKATHPALALSLILSEYWQAIMDGDVVQAMNLANEMDPMMLDSDR